MVSATQITWSLVGRVVENGPARSIPICGIPFTIGRRSAAVLSIPHQSVSGIHAEIRLDDWALWLHDLRSTNGTFLNGARVTDAVELRENDLLQFGQVAFRLDRLRVKNAGSTVHEESGRRALALVQFDKLLSEGLITPYFQRIVEINNGNAIGLEALARSDIDGLRSPEAMFRAAKELDVEKELSNMLRIRSAEIGSLASAELGLFFNSHPRESYDELLAAMLKLRRSNPSRDMTLKMSCNMSDMDGFREFRSVLHKHEIRIAYDDFGAGSEQLHELFECPPDFLKFDMTVIRGVDAAPSERQKTIATLVRIASDAGAIPLAEGIETSQEAEACQQLGFKLAQGFYFSRPLPIDACELSASSQF